MVHGGYDGRGMALRSLQHHPLLRVSLGVSEQTPSVVAKIRSCLSYVPFLPLTTLNPRDTSNPCSTPNPSPKPSALILKP